MVLEEVFDPFFRILVSKDNEGLSIGSKAIGLHFPQEAVQGLPEQRPLPYRAQSLQTGGYLP